MNLKSEQIRSDLSLDIQHDQKLPISKIKKVVIDLLGKDNCYDITVCGKKVICYNSPNKKEILLLASITYLGGNGQHPIFKKRMQLKKWYKDITDFYSDKEEYNVRFVGLYHYQGNIIFTEFLKDTYIKKKMNSSAAHVYTNDLYQAMKNDIFKRKDRNGNELVAVKYIKFKEYLDGKLDLNGNELFNLFDIFNKEFISSNWLTAMSAIPEMYNSKWSTWKETEWPGWYLEFKFDKFINDYMIENKIKYIGNINKKKDDLDFDIWFNEDNFYGDLKASDIKAKEAPGNDQDNFLSCINKYDKFWYIIYEHETIKDTETCDFEATRFRTNFIKNNNEWDKNKEWDELSYHSRMKHSIKFAKMSIIELNRVNYRDVLNEFNQGKQPTGEARKPKFKITKNNIDNFIVFQHDFIEIKN